MLLFDVINLCMQCMLQYNKFYMQYKLIGSQLSLPYMTKMEN